MVKGNQFLRDIMNFSNSLFVFKGRPPERYFMGLVLYSVGLFFVFSILEYQRSSSFFVLEVNNGLEDSTKVVEVRLLENSSLPLKGLETNVVYIKGAKCLLAEPIVIFNDSVALGINHLGVYKLVLEGISSSDKLLIGKVTKNDIIEISFNQRICKFIQ